MRIDLGVLRRREESVRGAKWLCAPNHLISVSQTISMVEAFSGYINETHKNPLGEPPVGLSPIPVVSQLGLSHSAAKADTHLASSVISKAVTTLQKLVRWCSHDVDKMGI